MIGVPQNSVPRSCDFFLSQGRETTNAGYSISDSGLKPHTRAALVCFPGPSSEPYSTLLTFPLVKVTFMSL
jgi:hypothetical protein